MNKILKGLLLSVLIVTLSVNMLPLGAQDVEGEAEPTVPPAYAIAIKATATLTLSGSTASTQSRYNAGTNLSYAHVYTFMQRYVDGVWRAASSTATCAWYDESYASDKLFSHSMTLTQSGYYRLKVVFFLYGTDGDMDRIEKYDYATYNP